MRKATFWAGVFFLFLTGISQAQTVTPTQIKTCQDLQNIQNNLAGSYVLANDIVDCNTISNFQPIGGYSSQYTPFKGSFDGQGHSIKGLTINGSALTYAGLFGAIDFSATVKNVVLDTINVTGGISAGALAGNVNSGTVSNVIVTNGVVNTPINTYFGYGSVGGLVGNFVSGELINSAVINTSLTGSIVGGLVGQLGSQSTTAQINGCYATGVISGSPYVGGLVGALFSGSISNSYSLAHLTGLSNALMGGLIGAMESSTPPFITDSFAAGPISYRNSGVVAYDIAPGSTDSVGTYWDTQATGQTTDRLTTTHGETTAQMYQQSTYVGWDFTNVWTISNGNDYPHLKWENALVYIHNCRDLQNMNNNLQGNYALASDITDCNTITNFQPVGASSTSLFQGSLDGKGYSIYNLSIEGSNTASGVAGLFGFMNGKVSDLYIKSSAMMAINGGYAGILAAEIWPNGSVNNVIVQGAVMGGNNTTLGGLAAVNNGTIDQVSANVNVAGTYLSYVGGIAGINLGSIQQSVSTGTVQGTSAGGLVGANNNFQTSAGTIQNSYSLATVILPILDEPSDNIAAGLVAEDWNDYHGNISNSYAAGLVKISGTASPNSYTLGGAIGILRDPSNGYYTISPESVYWDKQTTHQDHSAGLVTPDANGKTTAQMHEKATFVNWDFTTPVWLIKTGYPYLAWEPLQITLNLTGFGTGTITSSPGGLNCTTGSSNGCSAAFPTKQLITLNFSSSNNSAVSNWGACVPLSPTSCFIIPDQSTVLSIAVNPSFIVTATADTGGAIVPSGAVSIASGTNQTFTAVSSPGYSIDKLLVDGATVILPADGDYTLKNVKAAHTLTAVFDPEIRASVGTGGSISPTGVASIVSGGSKTYTITPQAGYIASLVLVDGSPVTLSSTRTYTFTDVTVPHLIEALFSLSTYNVTASADMGGSISPTGSFGIAYDGSQVFTVKPNTGYSIDKLLDNGVAVTLSASGSYTLKNVKAAHTLTAIFDPKITASAGTGGSISGAGVVRVVSGGSKAFTVTPKKGYIISTVLVDGNPVTLSSKDTYTFTDVTVPHAIAASFVVLLSDINVT